MMLMLLPDRFRRREAEQAFGGSVPAGNGAVQQRGDDGVVRRFHDRAEEAIAFGSKVSLRGGLQTQRSEQAGQLGLQADVIDEQYGEHETRGAEAIDAAEIETDIRTAPRSGSPTARYRTTRRTSPPSARRRARSAACGATARPTPRG